MMRNYNALVATASPELTVMTGNPNHLNMKKGGLRSECLVKSLGQGFVFGSMHGSVVALLLIKSTCTL